ncbi:phage major capsid protein [Clostridium beijerinckii]|uniref:phage major capsid protein n=2 Tax=Clostridium beijerinckii TaxID=1520 RepID=UPI001494C12A|nr:phage major capsid protein [Clostridium beijerinckii]NOW02473.1 HK97 family phage major capsid protein [Clostridium beijerinckii]NYC05595.1 HK97 family phage major capsid protein [Clostridium beijerinckii]
MKLKDLLALLDSKKTEVRSLIAEQKVTEAEAKMAEIRSIEKMIEIEKELEEAEKRDLESQRNEKKGTKVDKVDEMRSIVKKVLGQELTEEERAMVKTTDNSAVLPKQFVNQLIEIEKGYGSLEEYVEVIPVTKNEGTMPVSEVDEDELPEVLEGDDITDATLTTSDIAFKCAKVGEIYTLTSELLDDAEVEIEGLARRNFTAKTVRTKNAKIMKVIKDNAVAFTGVGSYEDINTAIGEAVPAVKAGLVTFTNPKGYSVLKNMKDGQKRPLNLVTEVNGKYYFNNKELVVVDETLLPTAEGKTATFYVCNPKELVKLFKRNEFTVARSTEAGFINDTVKVRILGRFDVKKGYARNCYVISF